MDNMQKNLLLVSIACLLIAATIIGIGLYPTSKIVTKEQTLGNQTAASFVNFTLASNNNLTVTFNASGNYIIGNSTMLKIVNKTGSIEYYERINDFPITVQSLNNTGEYVATFQPMQTTNSTTLTVTNTISNTVPDFPLIAIALYFGIPFIGSNIIFFAWRVNEDIFKSLKNEGLKSDKELRKPFFKVTSSTIFYWMFFFIFTYLLVYVSIVSLVFIYLLQINPLSLVGLGFSVPISFLITIAFCLYCLKIVNFLVHIDVRTCSDKIVGIQKIADVANYFYFGTFIVVVALLISYSSSSYFVFFPIYTIVITLSVIHSFFNIFNTMLTKEGSIIVCLSNFVEEYEKKGCDAEFRAINKASKVLAELIKPFNFKLVSSSISAALSYQILVKKNTAKIRTLINHVGETPINYDKLLPFVEDISSQGKMLDSKGLKGLPSLSDRAKEYIRVIGTLVSLISLLFALVKLFTGLS